mgnify:CR=1 FL=1
MNDDPSALLPSAWLSSAGRLLRRLGEGMLNVVYPPRCLGCGARPESVGRPLCPTCLQRLERASPMAIAARLDRLDAASVLDGAFALWIFDKGGALQAVQHALKYSNRPRYGRALGHVIAAGFAERHETPDGIVPVPLHRLRELERGYNQAAMLGRGLADALECPMDADLLTRPRPTRSQTHLSRADRWLNVSGAFDATRPVDGGTWLLVDDVLTTGSTAAAAAHTLKDAGADRVLLATLAMART